MRAKDLSLFICTYNIDEALIEEKNIVATFVPNCASLSLRLSVWPDRAKRVRLCPHCLQIQILNRVQPLKDARSFIFFKRLLLGHHSFFFFWLFNKNVESGIPHWLALEYLFLKQSVFSLLIKLILRSIAWALGAWPSTVFTSLTIWTLPFRTKLLFYE